MASLPTYCLVTFRDDAGRESTQKYRMKINLLDDFSNMDDVAASAQDIADALDTLTSCRVTDTVVQVRTGSGSGAAPEDDSSIGLYAFVRTNLSADNTENRHVIIPSPDMGNYEESKKGILDSQFETDYLVLNALIVDVEDGLDMDFDAAQVRERKVFDKRAL